MQVDLGKKCRTYDDPGRGMTCGPRELTQAIASWAGVMFFFLASSVSLSTMAKLCLRFWWVVRNALVRVRCGLLRLLGNEACDGAYRPLEVTSTL